MVLVLVNFHPVSGPEYHLLFCRIPNFHMQSRLLPSAPDSLFLYSYICLYSDISDLTYPTLNFDNHLSSKKKKKKKKEKKKNPCSSVIFRISVNGNFSFQLFRSNPCSGPWDFYFSPAISNPCGDAKGINFIIYPKFAYFCYQIKLESTHPYAVKPTYWHWLRRWVR